ncbi:hypothetical protein VTP01DRAFT_4356 [Rhizomucor pusillus]|uniref:uncharacterized protein n=1 Tax=Rhizomucor pusillus TaxID=4840 RepID=UPI00374419F3
MLSPPPHVETITEQLIWILGYLSSILFIVPILELRIPALDVLHAHSQKQRNLGDLRDRLLGHVCPS